MMPGLYIKLAGAIAGIMILGAIWWHGYHTAQTSINERHQAQLAQQIVKSATEMYLQIDRSEQAVRRLSDKMTELNNDKDQAKQEALRYANSPTKKCVVSPELRQSFDRIAKLHDRPLPPVDQQAPSESPIVHDAEGGREAIHAGGVRGANEERAWPLTDAVTNFAVQQLTGRLAQCVETKNALIDWEDERYELELKASGRQLIKEAP